MQRSEHFYFSVQSAVNIPAFNAAATPAAFCTVEAVLPLALPRKIACIEQLLSNHLLETIFNNLVNHLLN